MEDFVTFVEITNVNYLTLEDTGLPLGPVSTGGPMRSQV